MSLIRVVNVLCLASSFPATHVHPLDRRWCSTNFPSNLRLWKYTLEPSTALHHETNDSMSFPKLTFSASPTSLAAHAHTLQSSGSAVVSKSAAYVGTLQTSLPSHNPPSQVKAHMSLYSITRPQRSSSNPVFSSSLLPFPQARRCTRCLGNPRWP